MGAPQVKSAAKIIRKIFFRFNMELILDIDANQPFLRNVLISQLNNLIISFKSLSTRF